MKCVNCGSEVQLRSEHCHVCGQKVVVDFDVLAQSVHEDAAVERGQRIAGALKWVILALLICGALIYSINDLFDKPVVFDGSGLPAVPAPGSLAIELPTLKKPYSEPHPNPPLPQVRMSAFGYRFTPIKEKIRAASKGDIPAEKQKSVPTAISDGLKFLSIAQNPDGGWPVSVIPRESDQLKTKEYPWGDVGVSSLALLAFFGDGETWLREEKTQRISPFAEKLKKGVRWLSKKQDAEGRFGYGEAEVVHFMYNHGMATTAMCEAYGFSGDEQLRDFAQKGLDFIVKSQTAAGGWNYKANPEGDTDTSLSAWQVQALLAGREAGLKVPDACLQKAGEMYKAAVMPDGRVAYSLSNDDKIERISLAGVALMLRQLLGEDPRSPAIRKLADKVKEALPNSVKEWGKNWRANAHKDDEARAAYDPYRLFFSSYGMYFIGGKDWETWHDALKKSACEMQDIDGAWRTNDVWSQNGGTTYSTSMMLLTLEVYYRYQ